MIGNYTIFAALVVSLFSSSSPMAAAEPEAFPGIGKTYSVYYAELGSVNPPRKFTVLRAGTGSWYRVRYEASIPVPVGTKTKPETKVRERWLNFDWIVSATEVED